jgi:voltage-gated potassium channel
LELKEITLKKDNDWNGKMIKDLDISRQSIIVMIKRKGKTIVPSGSIILLEGDEVVMYTRKESD